MQLPFQILCDAIHRTLALAGTQDLLGDLVLSDRARERATAGEEVVERHGRVRLRLVHDWRLVRDLMDRDRRVDRVPVDGYTRVSSGVGGMGRTDDLLSFSMMGWMTWWTWWWTCSFTMVPLSTTVRSLAAWLWKGG